MRTSTDAAKCACYTHPVTGRPSTRERRSQCPVHRNDTVENDDEMRADSDFGHAMGLDWPDH